MTRTAGQKFITPAMAANGDHMIEFRAARTHEWQSDIHFGFKVYPRTTEGLAECTSDCRAWLAGQTVNGIR